MSTTLDRAVLITGAGGGLGRSHALAFARLGYAVAVNDIADPSAVVEEITAAGGRAVGVPGAVDDWDGAQAIVDAAHEQLGRLDVLVNNAGIIRDKSFAKTTRENIDAVLSVHLKGAFAMTKAAWPLLAASGAAAVVNTSSGSGLYGNFGQANYSAAKMGLVGLTKTLAAEGARAGIRVNAIAPLARSAMTEDLLPLDLLERLAPEWVSPLVAWLADPSCTESGQVYSCGAGRYARVAVCEGPGVRFDHVPSLEEIAAAAGDIDRIEGGTQPSALADQIALLVPPQA